MITNHTFNTFFIKMKSSKFFIRYHLESPFTLDKVHHLNKLLDKKDLLVRKHI